MTHSLRALALACPFGLVVAAQALSQTTSSCPQGGAFLTPAVVGGGIIREGAGMGTVNIGSTQADLEHAWGPPTSCTSGPGGVAAYYYNLSDDGGKSGLLVSVAIERGIVEGFLIMLMPHGAGNGPPVRTARGIQMLAPIQDVLRTYGKPDDPNAGIWTFGSQGIAFYRHGAGDVVSGIGVFRPGAVPRRAQ